MTIQLQVFLLFFSALLISVNSLKPGDCEGKYSFYMLLQEIYEYLLQFV